MLITKTDQIERRPMRPSDLQPMREAAEAMTKAMAVELALELLRVHSDPVVRDAAHMIHDTCAKHWIEQQSRFGVSVMTPTDVDIYDLVLEGPRETILRVGSHESYAVSVSSAGKTCLRLHHSSCGWLMIVEDGEVTVTHTQDAVVEAYRGRLGERGQAVPVEAGDVLRIGNNEVRLHAPQD